MTTILGDVYHCGDPRIERGPEEDPTCHYTLCGLDIMDMNIDQLAWDPPEHFMRDWWESGNPMPPRCPECTAHPDYGLLILGEL